MRAGAAPAKAGNSSRTEKISRTKALSIFIVPPGTFRNEIFRLTSTKINSNDFAKQLYRPVIRPGPLPIRFI